MPIHRFCAIAIVTAPLLLTCPLAYGADTTTSPATGTTLKRPITVKPSKITKVSATAPEVLTAQQYEKLDITNLEVIWPPADCKKSTWRVQVINKNPVSVSKLQIRGSYYLSNQQKWETATASPVFDLAANQAKTLEGTWLPGPYVTKFKVELVPTNLSLPNYEERMKDLALPATVSLDILPPVFVDDSWKVTLKNNQPTAECGINVQTYLVKKNGDRVPAGGLAIQVPANGQASVQNGITQPQWRTDFDALLVELRRAPTWTPLAGPGWTTVTSHSFPLPR